MTWLRRSIQLILAGLGYTEGVLTTLAYEHRHDNRLVIFMVGGFSLGLILSVSIFLEDSTILLLVQCIFYAFFFASSVVLVLFFSSMFMQDIHFDQNIFPPHFFPVILILAIASMTMIGTSLSFSFTSKYILHPPLPRDPESEATGWQSDLLQAEELSLNKSHRISFQPPITHLPLEGYQITDKTLRNKDSEGTLVVPGITGEDDVSLSWLVQASMSTHNIYENMSENWMDSTPRNFDMKKFDTFRHLPTHQRVSNFSSINTPKVRVARSNTTGLLLASKKFTSSAILLNNGSAKRSRSVSFTSGLLQTQVERKRATSGDTFQSKRGTPLESVIPEKDEEAQNSNYFHEGKRYKSEDIQRYNGAKRISELFANSTNDHVQDLLPLKPNNCLPILNSHLSFTTGGPQELSLPKDKQSLFSPEIQQALYPAFEPRNNENTTSSPDLSLLEADMLDEIESIPMAVRSWESRDKSETGMKNISLKDWESSKDQWLQLRNESGPIFFSSDPNRRLNESLGAASAPSLHTYREQSDHGSGLSTNTFSTLNDALYKCVTPPQHNTNQFTEQPAPDTSPIKKMIGRFKRKDSSVEINSPTLLQKHTHSNSIATSMISMASGISSRSGSPRKSRKIFFPKTLLDPQQKTPPSLNLTSLPQHVGASREDANISHKPGFMLSPADKFWEIETGELLDKSRVSSVPSAVIGEYDREKWRTMKELEKNATVL